MRKLATALGGLIAALAIIGIGAGTALAQDTESAESIRGVLRYEREPVEGVAINVATPDGEQVGAATTDAEGAWQIPVPGPGPYVVTLDAGTLPDDVPGVAQDTVSTVVNRLQDRAVLFRLGAEAAPPPPGTTDPDSPAPDDDEGAEGGIDEGADVIDEPEGEPAVDEAEVRAGDNRVIQLLVNGTRFGLILGLAALGLSLVFGTTGLTNFAHGELITFGAIAALLLNQAGLPILVAAAGAVVLSAAFGWAQDVGFWRPLRRRRSGLIALMIISIGVSLILRYLYLFIIGGRRQSYDQYVIQRAVDIGPFSVAPRDMWIMGICVVLLAAVAVALLRTRMGKATRAVADNPALAAASGVDVNRVVTVVWVVGTGLAGLAGILFGLIQQVDYLMGFRALLLVFAAVVLGGLGTAWGAMIGALVIGVFIELSTLVIPSELKNAGVLAVLIVILLIRPQGILGRRERVG